MLVGVTAFYTAVIVTILYTLGLYWWGKRRPVGKPMSWGEAFLAAAVVFGWFVLIYGLLPNAWLEWCDGALKWRADKIGIPLGDLHYWRVGAFHHTVFTLRLLRNNRRYFWIFPVNKGLLFPGGLTFMGRGKIAITASDCRDIGAVLIYGIMVGVQFKAWSWWQKRDRVKAATPELPTSAYGRPLVRKV
jgi:hypothetical protein